LSELTKWVRRGTDLPGQDVGYSQGLLAAICVLSLVGTALALRMLPREVSAGGMWGVATRLGMAGLLLAVTAWLLFLLALSWTLAIFV
jgi:hypothetical protein